ncbi:MAG: AzlC family ABC transporter permease [Coriobacteriia bacterium]|nr:AzlC family ABC transporter permease [Coriobacteriia bacterium]
MHFRRGLKLGLPIFLGYVPVGAAFGILACQYGFSFVAALVCSATALAGAGQFIALTTLVAGGNALTVLVACGVVNLRYVLFGATLSPYLRHVPPRIMAWLGFTLTDETFAINIADLRAGDATCWSMAGVGVIAWTGWVLGTAIGWLSSGWLGDPTRFGVDFAMAAMFSALFVALAENWRQVVCGVLAGALVCGLWLVASLGVALDANWFITIASLAGATVAVFMFRDEGKSPEEIAANDEILVTERAVRLDSRADSSTGGECGE